MTGHSNNIVYVVYSINYKAMSATGYRHQKKLGVPLSRLINETGDCQNIWVKHMNGIKTMLLKRLWFEEILDAGRKGGNIISAAYECFRNGKLCPNHE
jgi:hypothetical protein